MNLSILYRGPLSSCNYGCEYCPFAKHIETAEELSVDRAALDRFVTWIEEQSHSISVLFTPWGEGLVRKWYQDALIRLSRLPNVRKVAIQTNLSCKLDWVEACDRRKIALWCTYHPGEVTRERFLAKCEELMDRGVRFSVGVVGLKEHLEEIAAIRSELPPSIYVWINAYKREPNYYDPSLLEQLERIDPLFPVNNHYHHSRGERCHTGQTVISVAGDGAIRRCHFVPEIIGNIYSADWESSLSERDCPNESCGCHIGYVHLDRLKLYDVFGDGVLERIPAR